jgi:2-hydroxychromene-2-carboxylate isomerase
LKEKPNVRRGVENLTIPVSNYRVMSATFSFFHTVGDSNAMKQVNFYFDFVSPYPWLASHQLDELRVSAGAKFCFVPVLFAALLDHHSNMGPAEIPAKRRYTVLDTHRWAIHLGLKFKSPPAHPFNPLKALRVTSALDNDGLERALR